MVDSHCHLDFRDYDSNRREIVKRALDTGVHTLINIGTDLESSKKSLRLTEEFQCMYASVGLHPHDAKIFSDTMETQMSRLLRHDKAVAVGEIGLDYYRDLSPRKTQRRVFIRQLEMAVEHKLPVIIHTRESFNDTAGIIADYAGQLNGGVFHCFPGTYKDACRVIELGFYVGIGGVVTYPKARMAQVAAQMPLESILIETDCPFLSPVPYRGKTNQPAYVKYVVEKLAEMKGLPFEEVERITDSNCRKLFRLVELFEG
jgi:TatD DNase family protein